jgi:hypothetical protein
LTPHVPRIGGERRGWRPAARGAALALLTAFGAEGVSAQTTATWYIGTYSHDILVWDEASEEVVDRITVGNLVPNRIALNQAKTRLYVGEAAGQKMEVVDIATGAVIDAFTLSHDSVSVRIDGFAPHPSDDRLVLFGKRYIKHRDRYSVDGPFILEYDLATKQVTDTIPWPDGQPRENVNFQYAPDGETLYFFTNDIIAVDADSYEEVDRWQISRPLEPGLGRPDFGTGPDTYDEEGVATSLFRMTDPVQNRDMMGVARVRLSEKDVDFFIVGDDAPIGQFALAPGGQKAYALYDTVGRYEFWEFDLVRERVTRRHPFTGRPRMGLRVSADGEKLYVFIAGPTIDVYDANTFELLRTVTFEVDMRPSVVVPGPRPRR